MDAPSTNCTPPVGLRSRPLPPFNTIANGTAIFLLKVEAPALHQEDPRSIPLGPSV